ncbi:MAG: hypothetical protein JNK05_37410 [Myxococcales bacterium]|nr:hypothetical protein [Myxococcales bacterium]
MDEEVGSFARADLVTETERWAFSWPADVSRFSLDSMGRERSWALPNDVQIGRFDALWLADATLITVRQRAQRWVVERWTLDGPVDHPDATWRCIALLEIDGAVPRLGTRSWDARFALVHERARAWVIDTHSKHAHGPIAHGELALDDRGGWGIALVDASCARWITPSGTRRYAHDGTLLERTDFAARNAVNCVETLSARYALAYFRQCEGYSAFDHALLDLEENRWVDLALSDAPQCWMYDGLLYAWQRWDGANLDVFDPRSGERVRSIERVFRNGVERARLTLGGESLIAMDVDRWDRHDPRTLTRIEHNVGTSRAKTIHLSPSEELVAIGSEHALRVFSVVDGAQQFEHASEDRETVLAWMDDGALLVSREERDGIRLVELVFDDGVARERRRHQVLTRDRAIEGVSRNGSAVLLSSGRWEDRTWAILVRDDTGAFVDRAVPLATDVHYGPTLLQEPASPDAVASLDLFVDQAWTRVDVQASGAVQRSTVSPRAIDGGHFVCGGVVFTEQRESERTSYAMLGEACTRLTVDLVWQNRVVGSSAGVFAAFRDYGRTVLVLDFQGRLRARVEFSAELTAVALSGDGSRLFVATSECEVVVYGIDDPDADSRDARSLLEGSSVPSRAPATRRV